MEYIYINQAYAAWQEQLNFRLKTSTEIPYEPGFNGPPVKRHQTPAELLDTLQYIKENY